MIRVPLKESKSRMKSRRRYGLAAAIFNGAWGGSITVPMKFAPLEAKGTGFIFSFSIGASIVTALLWILRFLNSYRQTKNVRKSYNALPSKHFSTMWKPGCLSGLMWSVGNMASLISVQNLGVGAGYSLTQASMLCSGLDSGGYSTSKRLRRRRNGWNGSFRLLLQLLILYCWFTNI